MSPCSILYLCFPGFYLHMTQKKEILSLTVEQMVDSITKEMTVGCPEAPDIKCGVIGEVGCSWPLHGESLYLYNQRL